MKMFYRTSEIVKRWETILESTHLTIYKERGVSGMAGGTNSVPENVRRTIRKRLRDAACMMEWRFSLTATVNTVLWPLSLRWWPEAAYIHGQRLMSFASPARLPSLPASMVGEDEMRKRRHFAKPRSWTVAERPASRSNWHPAILPTRIMRGSRRDLAHPDGLRRFLE